MVSFSASSSRASSSLGYQSQNGLNHVRDGSGSSGNVSAASSRESLDGDDDENVTITAYHSLSNKGKEKSQEDLRLLAVSSRITELSYGISDIQTRIFEIQELRHQSQSSGDVSGATSIIDKALMNLDERLESVAEGIKAVTDTLGPLQNSSKTPTQSEIDENAKGEEDVLLRKHAVLMSEWDAVQSESEVLREELKEDKWLTVFRTATEQAEGMMTSLEKAVNRCQNFVWQVHRRGPDDVMSQSSHASSKSLVNFETYAHLMESFEAKKKHYVPATTKVLSIIDKGVQDRVTKNGECLRRHAECTQRWRNLRERIARTEAEMENARKMLLNNDLAPSESGSSSASKSTKNGFLGSPPDQSAKNRAPSVQSTLSRSVSPFRRFARKFTGGRRTPAPAPSNTPAQNSKQMSRTPSSEPTQASTLRQKRSSLFSFRHTPVPALPVRPVTPGGPSHKYSQSMTPESSPSSRKLGNGNGSTLGSALSNNRPAWNSSTKVDPAERSATMRARRSSSSGLYGPDGMPPLPTSSSNGSSPYKRSLSRSSMASSRPWSPVTSSISTAASSSQSIPPVFRPPSRARTPGNGPPSPRPRPTTPSHIPAPAPQSYFRSVSELDFDDDENPTSMMQRALSPGMSSSPSISTFSSSQRSQTPNGSFYIPPPRPPSRSMIPVPSLQFHSPSRPSSTMSNYRPESSMSFRGSAMRAQTPESALRQRAQQIPFYQGVRAAAPTPRPTLPGKLPPSSFKDSGAPRAPSRPGSRAGASTPTLDYPMQQYVPANPKDPLDAEVASIVNSIPHGLLVERIDPPLRTIPKEGEEIRAQYAFSNSLARKVINCRLTTLSRPGANTTNKRVMCRVGGGWQDLQLYILNRQAGM